MDVISKIEPAFARCEVGMHFETRDLKDYAEPIAPSELQPGRTYFSLQFLDEDLLIPILEPLIFLGVDLLDRNDQRLYFQHYESYRQGIRIESASIEERHCFQIASSENINHIFEYERALDLMLVCSLKRRANQG